MRPIITIALLVLVVAMVFSCSASLSRSTTQSATPTQAALPSVPWKDYAPTVKTRIDEAASRRDCAALQKEFDTAFTNDAATRSRTGHGNSDLMEYIDRMLRDSGCYKR